MKNNLNTTLEMLRTQLLFLKESGVDALPVTNKNIVMKKQNKTDSTKKDSVVQYDQNYSFNNTKNVFPELSVSLRKIQEEIGDCKRCKLCEKRTKIVFGEGNPDADLVFVGEGPGRDEDLQGRPFVGRAGQMLTKIIENGMKLKRKNVFICNIVKCRPPGNRNPENDEIDSCKPFLEKQIAAIKPKVIISLGLPATSTLLNKRIKISEERGKWHTYNGIKLMPTYHPSYLLRNYTPKARLEVFDDVKKVLQELNKDEKKN